MSKQNRIFIVGQSGAGKGVVAEAVAKKLGWQFINADIFSGTTHVGRRLANIIGTEGESRFNQTLTEILSHQLTLENIVVTTDENIICDSAAREILQSEFTVFIDVSTQTQIDRLRHYRPLLASDAYPELLEALHQERDDWFAQVANFIFNSDNGDIDRDVKKIIDAFQS